MKKILLATSALVLSAGMASAQGLSIGGDARMGVQYLSTGWGGGLGTWRMESRTNLNFSATVEADHGLTFGMFSRVRRDDAMVGDFNGHNVWVEAMGLRLTFGNISGPAESFGVTGSVPMGYSGGTFAQFGGLYSGAGTYNIDSFGGGPAQTAMLSYTMGDIRVAAARSRGGHTEVAGQAGFDGFTVAGAWANNAQRFRTLSASYNAGDFTVGGIYSRINGNDLLTLTGSAQLGGGTASAYIGEHQGNTVGGVSYRYGLGGGATIGGALERTTAGANRAELGVIFSF